MSKDSLFEEIVEEINKSWRKTTEGVLETARLCFEASKKFSTGELTKLKKQLEFSPATFSKLSTIGGNPQLQEDPIKSLLPPSYSIVYELAKLDDSVIDLGVKEGVINPGMSRSDLSTWLGKGAEKTDELGSQTRPRTIATLLVPADYDLQKQTALEKALDKLRAQFGFNLERPRDPEMEALNRQAEKMSDYIRREARRFIAALKARRFQSAGKLSAAEKKRLWPYQDTETNIPADATWEQVKAVLDFVGNGDQFERIRDEALRLFDVPESVVSTHTIEDPEDVLKELRSMLEAGGKKRYNPEKSADFR